MVLHPCPLSARKPYEPSVNFHSANANSIGSPPTYVAEITPHTRWLQRAVPHPSRSTATSKRARFTSPTEYYPRITHMLRFTPSGVNEVTACSPSNGMDRPIKMRRPTRAMAAWTIRLHAGPATHSTSAADSISGYSYQPDGIYMSSCACDQLQESSSPLAQPAKSNRCHCGGPLALAGASHVGPTKYSIRQRCLDCKDWHLNEGSRGD